MTRFIFVVGGVMSGVGKGTCAASIGRILKNKGFNVTAVKIDPYINVDAGTMNPVEHGEVYVTDDGDETDQDIGTYERFLDINAGKINYMTTGRVYQAVISRERNLEYGGRCVEVVPHVPEEVIRRLNLVAKKTKANFVLIEVGGTVGEYQNILFLEAARMLKNKFPDRVLFVIVSYLPIPSKIGEMKTKPTQYAVRTLNSAGIQPDIIIGRGEEPLDGPRKRKLSIFCSVGERDIISAPDVDHIYEVPVNFEREQIGQRILKKFNLRPRRHDGTFEWQKLVRKIKRADKEVKIGIVGKYFTTGNFVLSDVYLSVIEAVKHAAWANNRKPVISWLNSEEFERDNEKIKILSDFDGVIIPGGFGTRGVEGKIAAIKFCRENKIPYFGLCYGMQLAVVEYARNVLGLKDANTTEINPETKNPVIHIMPEQEKNVVAHHYGGSMRLGSYPCVLAADSLARQAYGKREIHERHRHRYEVNNDYRERLAAAGLKLSGLSPDKKLVEIIELPGHPFFVGTQFHPEFKSRPLTPHPLFKTFISACIASGRG